MAIDQDNYVRLVTSSTRKRKTTTINPVSRSRQKNLSTCHRKPPKTSKERDEDDDDLCPVAL